MKIGDKVKVINTGKVYTSYADWAALHDLDKWKSGNMPKEGEEYVIVRLAEHGEIGTSVIAGIESKSGKHYMIERRGLVVVESLKTFVVGNKVYDMRFGNGVVTELCKKGETDYPVVVKFNQDGAVRQYTQEGKYMTYDINPTLFHGNNLRVVTIECEPVYEWQWIYSDNGVFETTIFATDVDVVKKKYKNIKKFTRIEESKRSRD